MSTLWWLLAALVLFPIGMITPGLFLFTYLTAGAPWTGLAPHETRFARTLPK